MGLPGDTRASSNGKRGLGVERHYSWLRGEHSEGRNPMGGCGAKQSHEAQVGSNHCEGEKPWEWMALVRQTSVQQSPVLFSPKGTEPHGRCHWIPALPTRLELVLVTGCIEEQRKIRVTFLRHWRSTDS
jgi:hypothetical protein